MVLTPAILSKGLWNLGDTTGVLKNHLTKPNTLKRQIVTECGA
jgi:hypothetical protein